MRNDLFRKLSTLLVFMGIAFSAMAPAAYAKGHKSTASRTKTITASGCVTAGVESGCLVLTDFKTKTVYTLLLGSQKKPKIGTAIRFTGAAHSGPTICMQGQAVEVKKWTPLRMKCPRKPSQ